jgi:5-formyltetrahydrofolate cyclo-ligase
MSAPYNKQVLRQHIRAHRKSLSTEWINEHSHDIVHHVLQMPLYQQAHHLGIYLSLPGEVQTAGIVAHALQTGKCVYVPCRDPHTRSYGWATCEEHEPLVKCGVTMQPATIKPCPVDTMNLILAPCMAVDRQGHRLGHGGGHFDRMFKTVAGLRMTLCFSFQFVEHIPSDAWDIPMDAAVTESGIVWFSNQNNKQKDNSKEQLVPDNGRGACPTQEVLK